ncbi:MAG TPA: nuclear transport factor 2 family protein [Vicinamibacteria bacterium]|nr:nuclear transport factor 2 family protein [Vicinamibacteria bacterium]
MRLCLIAVIAAVTPTLGSADEAQDARAVVEAAYVQGVHASFSADAMRRGFHPDFRMYTLRDGALSYVTRDEWIARLEKRAAEASPRSQIKADYPLVDVTGNTAVVRVELHRDGKHVFTDYLSLYRFADGWKIVAKVFQAR